MNLVMTAELRAKVLRVRESQMEELTSGRLCVVDAFFAANEVVRLKAGMGRASYVGTDGQVTGWNFGEGCDPEVITEPQWIAWEIVRWAKDVGLEELVAQLPSKPPDSTTCDLCQGNRVATWRTFFPDGNDELTGCLKCHGLGWIGNKAGALPGNT
jgi:hypothetical protein